MYNSTYPGTACFDTYQLQPRLKNARRQALYSSLIGMRESVNSEKNTEPPMRATCCDSMVDEHACSIGRMPCSDIARKHGDGGADLILVKGGAGRGEKIAKRG
jgi:hypothetical protein